MELPRSPLEDIFAVIIFVPWINLSSSMQFTFLQLVTTLMVFAHSFCFCRNQPIIYICEIHKNLHPVKISPNTVIAVEYIISIFKFIGHLSYVLHTVHVYNSMLDHNGRANLIMLRQFNEHFSYLYYFSSVVHVPAILCKSIILCTHALNSYPPTFLHTCAPKNNIIADE